MAVNCDPSALLQASACFKCIPPGAADSIEIYLLQQIAGNSMTADELLEASASFRRIPPGAADAVKNYLLCQAVNAVSP